MAALITTLNLFILAVPSTFAGENMDVLTTTQNLFTRVRICRCFDNYSLGPFNLSMSRINL
uniref:Uncharacterized protein n=1 Tax=Magallana gigas TaxID=29159 RepID=K1Q8D8_MAGGI